MGANEKHAATYHGEEYTPTTAIVHSIYMTAWNSTVDPVDQQEIQDKARDEFTRWLETVRAEAKTEALREAASEIDRLDSDVVMYDEDLNARPVSYWLRRRATWIQEASK